MADTYRGYTGKDTGSFKAIETRAKAFSSGLKKREEEQFALEQAQMASTANPEADKNNFFADAAKNVGNVVGGALGFINDNAFKATPWKQDENEKKLAEGNAKVDADLKEGKIDQGQAEVIKQQAAEALRAPTLLEGGKAAVDFALDSPRTLGQQVANSNILQRREGNTVVDEELGKNYQKFIDDAENSGQMTREEADAARKRITDKIASGKESIKVATEQTGAAPNQSEGAFAAIDVAGSLTGGLAAGNKFVNAAKDGKKIKDAAKVAEEAPIQKLASEPTEAFYTDRRQAIADEIEQINNMDGKYLEENGLVRETKSEGLTKAEEQVQSPERVAAQSEAAKMVADAEKQIDQYNDIMVKSPYHRKADAIDDARTKEIEQLSQAVESGAVDEVAAQAAIKEVDAKYTKQLDDLGARYPDDAAEAPALMQAIEEASAARIQAHQNLEKITMEDKASIEQSGGMLKVPDPVAIRDRTKALEDEIASIDTQVEAAKTRMANPAATSDEANQKINDVLDTDLSPESFDETGKITPIATENIQKARTERAKATVEGEAYYDAPEAETLTNPTNGETAANAGYERLLASDVISADTKKAITALGHDVHKDDILIPAAAKLVKDDIDSARELFFSRTLIAKNGDAQMQLGNQLARYYDARGLATESGQVWDEILGNASVAGRTLRATGAIYKANPRYIVKHAETVAKDKGKPLTEATINQMDEAVKDITNMKDGPDKQAALLALREMAEQKGVWEKIGKWGAAIASLPRGLLATGDLSFALRQGAYAGATHPVIWARATGKSLRFAVDPKYFAKEMDRIATLTDKNGNGFAEMFDNMKLSLDGVNGQSDEVFGSSALILESKAAKKLGVGHVIAASDRAYTGAATVMRAEIAKSIINGMGGVKKLESLGKKAQRDLGRVIDTSTGRGRGGDPIISERSFFETAAPALSNTLFAARFWKSNIDKINPVYYAQLSGPAKKEALKNLAGFTTAISTVLSAAAAAGADVSADPRSSDFMKIKVGDTRFDIMGGLQQNIVLAARQISNQKTNTNGDVQNLGEDPFGPTRLSVLGDFVQNKTAPTVNTGMTLLEGKDIAGNELDPWKVIAGMFLPLGIQGAQDTYEATGGNTAATVGTAATNFVGIGTNTYGSNNTALSPADKRKVAEAPRGEEEIYKAFYQAAGNVVGRGARDDLVTKLYKEGNPEKAKRKAAEFNATVNERMSKFFEKYPQIDEDLQDELRNNIYITLTPSSQKTRSQ